MKLLETSSTTLYLSAGDQEISEYTLVPNVSLTLNVRYVYGPGLDEPLAIVGTNLSRYFFHADPLGSTVAATNPGSGTIYRNKYTAYGLGASSNVLAYQFAGRRYDAETGLYYNRARMYSPTLGRFLQPDPIKTDGGINIYAYVGNDPLNRTDPRGEWTFQIGGEFTFGFGSWSLTTFAGVAFDGQGGVGTYYGGGFGLGPNAQANLGISAAYSNAETISGLAGPFLNASAGGGYLGYGTIDTFAGLDGNKIVSGGGLTLGLGFGAGASVGETYTKFLTTSSSSSRQNSSSTNYRSFGLDYPYLDTNQDFYNYSSGYK